MTKKGEGGKINQHQQQGPRRSEKGDVACNNKRRMQYARYRGGAEGTKEHTEVEGDGI